MSARTRTIFIALQGLSVGLGAGIHVGYYARGAGESPEIVVAGHICYIVAFGLLATLALLERLPPPHNP